MEHNITYENIPVSRLVPYARNSRTHSDKQIDQLASSIREFGFLAPCIIDKDFNVLAGHGRVEAAKKLNMERVPCLRVEHLNEHQKKAYILIDNRLNDLSGWDKDLLKIELEELLDDGRIDLDAMGFDLPDLKELNISIGEEEFNFSPNLPGDKEHSKDGNKQFIITVILENEEQQEDLFRELNEKGFKVKAK